MCIRDSINAEYGSYKMINLVCIPNADAKLISHLLSHVYQFLSTSPLAPHLVGLSSLPDIANPLREWFNKEFNSKLEIQTRLRCYSCQRVDENVLKRANDGSVAGKFVVATEEHFEECVVLMAEFDTEVHRPAERMTNEKVRARVKKFIEAKRVWLWTNDKDPQTTHRNRIVSVVMSTRETPSAIGINSVYTPSDHRGKGYATALVAKATQHMLDTTSYNTVFLFADLDYPASNAVYVRVGFVPVEDCVQWVQ
eukprot:TRINITY_DN1209_c0_g1_i1.p1 TRINITY_DN1209_c0_g1~~TRINITY_DN1209_c0_g1_i1.p1  ORF type:complete len:253 (-),score=40.00 TRINITY_DN1209_c0_g1_i1:325-1083(-)